ncbi:MAG TPA: glycerol-3-phosphate 1-O-acyltransferase PlsY [Coriobacteriia bacterium]
MVPDILVAAVCLGAAYLLGGIPFALVVGRLFYGTDIREEGSGNLGATNTFRVLGAGAGLFVLILDAAKGAVAVSLAWALLAVSGAERAVPLSWFLLLVTFAVMAGHVYSPYLRLKGGKGVAAAAGALLVTMPLAVLVLLVVFAAVVAVSRWVSLASVVAAALFPFVAFALYSRDPAAVALTVIAAALVIWRHRTNISRIIAGTETRIGENGRLAKR